MRKIISIPRPAAPSASHSSGDEFSTTTIVEPDVDESAYVGATDLFRSLLWFRSYRSFSRFLERHRREIRDRHPLENRRKVHAGDVAKAVLEEVLSSDPDVRAAMIEAMQARLEEYGAKPPPSKRSKSRRRK